MEFRKIRALRGPNIWANSPVLEAWLDLKEWKDISSAMVDGFNDRLMSWLPGLIEHECSYEQRGGFLERLREGTYPAHILEHVALELQSLAGTPVGYGRARETAEEGVYRVVIKYKEETVGRACLESARELILAALEARPFDTEATVKRLRETLQRHGLDPVSAAVARAASERGIPCQRLGGQGLLVLGHGVRQRRFQGVETERALATSAAIAEDKESSRFFPRGAGVPGHFGRAVETAVPTWDADEDRGSDDGEPPPTAEAILGDLFPGGEDGRIPVVAVTGVNGKTTTTRLIAHILRRSGLFVGMTCTDGLFLDDRRVDSDDCAGPKSARIVLMDGEVEAAVLETARGGIFREGLGFDRCAVAVVTNIGEGDHLGMENVFAPEDLVKVKRTVVDVVLPTGWAVLNAADPLVAGMAGACRGGVIYFALDGDHPVVREHRASGKRAAFVRDGRIVLAEGRSEDVLVGLENVPVTRDGRIGFQVENVLAATAAAWALGLSREVLRDALATFDSEPEVTPGRFNVLDAGGATVIVDFGHNPSALEALAASLGAFEGTRRTVVLSADGDRTDQVIIRQAEILAPHFDRVVLYEEAARNRGRATGEIPALLRRGLESAEGAPEIIEVFGEQAAITQALRDLEPGDTLLVLIDAVDTSLGLVRRLLAERNGAGVNHQPCG